jgi:Ca2+-binding EF-hand superfamily protein
LISNARLLLKSWDKDGDGKLNQSEVQTMVNEAFRRMRENVRGGPTDHPELESQRRGMLAFYASQDTNHDGYLTLDELLKGPLANFDCMDSNHDGKLSNDEIFDGMDRCPSVNLDEYGRKRLDC